VEKIIFENENEKHISLPDGSVRILKKKGSNTHADARKSDFRAWIGQRWWRQELKGLDLYDRGILISRQLIGAKYPNPSERFIAKELGISRNTTKKHIEKLKKLGLW